MKKETKENCLKAIMWIALFAVMGCWIWTSSMPRWAKGAVFAAMVFIKGFKL